MVDVEAGLAGEALAAVMREAVRTEMAELRRFVDRRIAELSAELHASQELAEFSEDKLVGHLSAIRAQIADMVAPAAPATRNSGAALESVVVATEAAANRILEAAEAIADWVAAGGCDPSALNDRVATIFEACSFQDLTGQRLRRAIEHLHSVEALLDRLGQAAGPGAMLAKTAETCPPPGNGSPPAELEQPEIDRLLAGQ